MTEPDDDMRCDLCAFDGDACDIAGIVQDPEDNSHKVGLLGPDEQGWALTPDQADDLARQLLEYAREAREHDGAPKPLSN